MHDSAYTWRIATNAKTFWSFFKHFWNLVRERNCRILNGLWKQVFSNCPIMFLDRDSKIKLLPAPFSCFLQRGHIKNIVAIIIAQLYALTYSNMLQKCSYFPSGFFKILLKESPLSVSYLLKNVVASFSKFKSNPGIWSKFCFCHRKIWSFV